MIEIVNKLLLTGDTFMPETHLKQPGFTCSACGSFTKNKERILKLKETGDTNYTYKNELDKAYFQHGMVYEDFEDLNRRTFADKVLHDKAFNIAKDIKYDGYQCRLASMVYKFFDKTYAGRGVNIHANKERPLDLATQKLAEELHKQINRKFKKRAVYSALKDNIWGADLVDM